MSYSKKVYSDECGGEFNVRVEESDARCEPGKDAFRVRVTKHRKVVWAPTAPMCVPAHAVKRARLIEDALGFFEHQKCARGAVLGRAGKRRRRR